MGKVASGGSPGRCPLATKFSLPWREGIKGRGMVHPHPPLKGEEKGLPAVNKQPLPYGLEYVVAGKDVLELYILFFFEP